MEGRSGTGSLGVTYFYYVCRAKDCGLRVSADELEGVVLDRLSLLATDESLLERLTAETNARQQRQAPTLSRQRKGLQKSLADLKAEADGVLLNWSALDGQDGRAFLTEKLNELAQQRADLKCGLVEAEEALTRVNQDVVDAATVAEPVSRSSARSTPASSLSSRKS